MLKTGSNPLGLPMEAFDAIRAGVAADRSQFYHDLSFPFYGFNREGAKVSEGVSRAFWAQSMQVGIKGALDCIRAFSESDFREDLKKIDVPTFIAHGDDDQTVPIVVAGLAGPSGAPAWKTIPSWYLIPTQDKVIPPAVQRTMARRADPAAATATIVSAYAGTR